jgi:4-amino-4-deoxy-L-arabinose transferase-like glycosyltransferase
MTALHRIAATIRAVPPTEYAWLAVTLALSLALRIPFMRVAMIADEGGYAYATRGWLNGTGHLYDDLWISRPQGIFLLYGLIFETLGTGTVAIRIAAWIACALTTILVWAIARRWTSPATALYAAALFGITSSLPSVEGFTANAEIFMGVPAALAAWLTLRAWERHWPIGHLVAIGIATGIATQLKPAGLVMAFVAIGFMRFVDPTPWPLLFRRSLWILAGLAIIGLPSFVHGWFLGWSDFIYATVTYRLTSQSTVTNTLGGHLSSLGTLFMACYGLIVTAGIVLLLEHRERIYRVWFWLAFEPHPLGRHRRLPRTPPRSRSMRTAPINERDPLGFFLVCWSVGAFFGIAIGGDWWPHYLIQILPPFAIWLAKTSVELWHHLRRSDGIIMVLVLGGLILMPFRVVVTTGGEPDAITRDLFGHVGYPAQDNVAAYLRDHTAPGTRIFVAFDQAAIYYLADRPPAYRHLYAQELQAIPEAYSEILSVIASPDRPVYIVTTRQADLFPDHGTLFWQLVAQYYTLETEIEGIPIYRAIGT